MNLPEEIQKVCASWNFDVESVAIDGDVAVITPASLDALPNSETLRGIADEVRQFGIKHVALELKPE